MILGSSRFINLIDLDSIPRLVINGVEVPYVTSIKLLGAIITPTLNWSEHVNAICSRVYKTLYQLRFKGKFLSKTLKQYLITALVFPLVDYVCVAFLDISVVLDLRLQRAINACVRFIFGLRRDEHISPYYKQLKWLSVATRREYFIGCLMYRVLAGSIPIAFVPEFKFKINVSQTGPSTRSAGTTLVGPRVRTATYDNSFAVRGVRMWNGLPVSIRDATTLSSFKVALFNYLMS
jgi:hypothetical protein